MDSKKHPRTILVLFHAKINAQFDAWPWKQAYVTCTSCNLKAKNAL